MNCTCSDCYEGCDWDCPECGPSTREFVVEKVRSSVGRFGRRIRRRVRYTRGSPRISTPSRAGLLSDELVVDMDEVIAELDPDTSQFTTMLMKLPHAGPPKFSWLEDELYPRFSWSHRAWPPREEDFEWEGWETQREQWERERDHAISVLA